MSEEKKRREARREYNLATFGTNNPNVKDRQKLAEDLALKNKQEAALAAGFSRPTPAATGDVLDRRKELFAAMQGMGYEGAAGMKDTADSLGVTSSGFKQALNRIPFSPATPPADTTPADKTPSGGGLTPFIARPAKPVVEPVSKIGKKPASEVLSGMRASSYFGAGKAKENIKNLGQAGAVADFRRRESESEYEEDRKKGLDRILKRNPAGSAQSAMDEALARIEGRKATDLARITTGLTGDKLSPISIPGDASVLAGPKKLPLYDGPDITKLPIDERIKFAGGSAGKAPVDLSKREKMVPRELTIRQRNYGRTLRTTQPKVAEPPAADVWGNIPQTLRQRQRTPQGTTSLVQEPYFNLRINPRGL